MKSRIIYPVIIIVFLVIFVSLNGFFGNIFNRSSLKSAHEINEQSSATKSNKDEQHQKDISAIHQTWVLIREAKASFQAGRYDEALDAYKKAYDLDKGSRAISGFGLAQTYQALGKYDEAVYLLDGMITNGELSKLGVDDAKKLKNEILTLESKIAN